MTAFGAPPSDSDLLLYSTRGIGPAYKELIIALQTRDSVVPFEELFDKIIYHEIYLLHHEQDNTYTSPPTTHLAKHHHYVPHYPKPNFPSSAFGLLPPPFSTIKQTKPPISPSIVCQYCDKRGHDVKRCFKLFPHLRLQHPIANHVTTHHSNSRPWIVNSGASHHVTSQFFDVSLHQPYEGLDDIVIGDGLGLKITHTSSMCLSPSFNLLNVLCVPTIKQNLIFVSQFCCTNNTSIDFFPSHFVVKDLCTKTPLLCRKNKCDLYEWPTTNLANKRPVVALSTSVHSTVSLAIWHGHLGHPSSKILKSLASFGLLSLSSSVPSQFVYQSCFME